MLLALLRGEDEVEKEEGMTEYLISDELLTSIRRACCNAGKAGKEVFTVKAPSIEIVRCRDCEDIGIGMMGLQCDRNVYAIENGECVPAAKVVSPDHFCAWGKRREDA